MMWAQVLTGRGSLCLMEMEEPGPISDEILVRIESAAICNGSDPYLFRAGPQKGVHEVFGHEPYGVIIHIGHAVKGYCEDLGIAVNDRISWWFSTGAFAQYVSIDPRRVAIMKDSMGLGKINGPLLEPLIACYRGIKALGDLDSKKVLILGQGPCGLLMSSLARMAGALSVSAWEISESSGSRAKGFGCDHWHNPANPGVIEDTQDGLKGWADVVLDCMGNDSLPEEPTLSMALSLLAPRGGFLSFGHPEKGRRMDVRTMQSKEITLINPVQDIREVQGFIRELTEPVKSGIIPLGASVTSIIELSQVSFYIPNIEVMHEQLKIIVDIEGAFDI